MKQNSVIKSKKTVIFFATAFVLIIAILFCIVSCNINGKMKSHVQIVNTNESLETINNPDQGFYRPIYVKLNDEGISYNKNIVTNATQLYHLRIDISAFSQKVNGSTDKLLTQSAIDGLESLLNYLKQRGKSAIVRFAYDPSFAGSSNKEPSMEIILEHIKQVSRILNDFQTTITAIEVGLIGPWGEMHTSQIADSTNINGMIEVFLNNATNLPILVRTPKMIYDYLGITIKDIDDYVIDATQKAYRLGMYNDGYLGSSSDLGTYTNRIQEIQFLSKQTSHLPYGGEVVIPSSTLHNIENCLPEMNQIHLSYLNVEWNNEVISKWKNSTYTSACGNEENYYGKTAFEYISNRMGYRFLLKKSIFEYSNKFDKLNIKLSIDNLGFGNLNKIKQAKLLFVDENKDVKYSKQVGIFDGGINVNYSTDLSLENGNYEVFLCIYGEEIDGLPAYTLQFANCDIWDATLQANKIGELKIQR